MLASELCIGCGCAEELRCERVHGRAVEGGEFTQLLVVRAAWRGPRRPMMET